MKLDEYWGNCHIFLFACRYLDILNITCRSSAAWCLPFVLEKLDETSSRIFQWKGTMSDMPIPPTTGSENYKTWTSLWRTGIKSDDKTVTKTHIPGHEWTKNMKYVRQEKFQGRSGGECCQNLWKQENHQNWFEKKQREINYKTNTHTISAPKLSTSLSTIAKPKDHQTYISCF